MGEREKEKDKEAEQKQEQARKLELGSPGEGCIRHMKHQGTAR